MAAESSAGDIQREILVSFLDEAGEALEELDVRLVALEENPSDQDNIGAVFRAVHTIKGNSSFFGLMQVKKLAHQMEDLLDALRHEQFSCNQIHVDGLLRGVDELKAILERVRKRQCEVPSESSANYLALIAFILNSIEQSTGRGALTTAEGATGSGPSAAPLDAKAEACWRNLRRELQQLATAKLNPAVSSQLARVQQLVAELAPKDLSNAPAPSSEVTQAGAAPPNPATCERKEPKSGSIPSNPASPTLTPAGQAIAESPAAAIATEQKIDGAAVELPGPPSAGRPKVLASSGAEPAHRTMRIEESSIEEFLDYVGDLIITREMFGHVGGRLRLEPQMSGLSAEFQRAMTAFTALSHNLQASIMKIRRVKVKGMLQKAPRIVRDVARRQGKQAHVVLEGEELQVDKSLLEALEDPFVHMMRNAIDHGMETPEARVACGKPPEGTITVSMFETGDSLQCRIADDGGGIDVQRLKAKALSAGLISPATAAHMSVKDAFDLVFSAGLSTAETVTEVSGRGVGMDVVKRNIVELGGHIDIESELTQGTAFTIHLPKAVSLQIFDGFLVRIGRERFVLPLRSVQESFQATEQDVHYLAETGEIIARGNRFLPLLRSGDLLSIACERRSIGESIVVAVDTSDGTAGLLVDEVLGVQQVVLREIDGLDAVSNLFAGGAVLGDGLVAMVLDVERVGAVDSRAN